MDLFGDLLVPVQHKHRAPLRARRQSDDLVISSGGLFDLTDVLCRDRFQARFHSGASAYYDALGLVQAGKDVGTVATVLNVFTMHLLREYVQDGGRWFIDSGAFGAFQSWLAGLRPSPESDFEAVFETYDAALRGLEQQACGNIWLVMPDIIGHHAASLDLLRTHRDRILAYIASGAQIIVPVQKGACRAAETAERVFDILGTRKVILGIPSKAAAMDVSDVATIRHDRFHVLGRCALTIALYSRVYAFLEHNPGAVVTCDANRIRACLPEIGHEHRDLIEQNEGGHWSDAFDDTELVYDVLNTPNWMTVPQITAIARSLGIQSKGAIRQWVNAHKFNPDGLKELIDEVDPEGVMLAGYAIPAAFDTAAREHLSARLRSDAVRLVFAG